MRRPVQLACVGSLLCVLVTGCGLLPGSKTDVCVDWVHFETAQDQFRQAALVVIGTPAGTDAETRIYGYTAQVHVVEVGNVLKGDPGPRPLRMASMPLTCTGGVSYPEGDPLDGQRRMLIYATNQNGSWFTMTPDPGCRSARPRRAPPLRNLPSAEVAVQKAFVSSRSW